MKHNGAFKAVPQPVGEEAGVYANQDSFLSVQYLTNGEVTPI